MDFRFQRYIREWALKNLGDGNFDRVAWAGGVFDIEDILEQIGLSKKLHSIKKVVLINHEDCGKYGEMGTKEKHSEDLNETKEKILEIHPDLTVETYFLSLDGTFEEV